LTAIVITVFGVIIVAVIVIAVFYVLHHERKDRNIRNHAEVETNDIKIMADYIRNNQAKEQAMLVAKQEKRDLMKHQLDTFKQTKEELKDKLKSQLDERQWEPLSSILNNVDKGGVGIYVLYNQDKDKYYVGQAKQIYKRIKDHFFVEDIALDFLAGDKISFKYLTANELDDSYRLDHIEKTGIEIYEAGTKGYNKTAGNI